MRKKRRTRDPDHERRRDRRREELLDAAVSVIRERGADASMDALAAGGGVTKPILYRHFGDRGGLVDAVAERFTTAFIAELTDALVFDPEAPADERTTEPGLTVARDDTREVLRRGVDAFVAFVERDPEIYRFLTRQASATTASTLIERVARHVAVVLGERLRALGLDSGPAEPWAFGIVGMVHMAGHWWLERRTMPRERLVAYLTDLLWHGLGAAALGTTVRATAASPDAQEVLLR